MTQDKIQIVFDKLKEAIAEQNLKDIDISTIKELSEEIKIIKEFIEDAEEEYEPLTFHT